VNITPEGKNRGKKSSRGAPRKKNEKRTYWKGSEAQPGNNRNARKKGLRGRKRGVGERV